MMTQAEIAFDIAYRSFEQTANVYQFGMLNGGDVATLRNSLEAAFKQVKRTSCAAIRANGDLLVTLATATNTMRAYRCMTAVPNEPEAPDDMTAEAMARAAREAEAMARAAREAEAMARAAREAEAAALRGYHAVALARQLHAMLKRRLDGSATESDERSFTLVIEELKTLIATGCLTAEQRAFVVGILRRAESVHDAIHAQRAAASTGEPAPDQGLTKDEIVAMITMPPALILLFCLSFRAGVGGTLTIIGIYIAFLSIRRFARLYRGQNV